MIASLIAVLTLTGSSLLLCAQDAAPKTPEATPKITAVQPGADSFYADLDYVMSLTTPEEQRQLNVVKEYIDVFLVGLDRTKPIRLDLVFGEEGRRYVSSFPLKNLKDFQNKNLTTIGINYRSRGQDYWKLSGAFEGFMRKVGDYIIFAEKAEEIPRGMADPIPGVQSLLDKKYDLAGELNNPAEGQDTRRQRVQKERTEIIGALKQTKEETPEDFALRKKFFETQFDEMERFYAESKRLLLGWTLDTKQSAKKGQFHLEFAPLPSTPLAAACESLGAKPSRFANVAKSDKSTLSLRLTHPLDTLRMNNFSTLFEMFGGVVKKDIDADAELSAPQKDAAKKIADMTTALFVNTAKGGLADGFLEAHANDSGKNTLVGAFQAVDAAKVPDILKLIPQARPDQKVEFDVATEGDVKIHKAAITGKQYDVYKDFFGTNEIYVGTSKDVVWFATGEKSLDELKAAIQKGAQPAPASHDGTFFAFSAKMGPWVELRNKRDPKAGDPKMRQMAIDAFKLGEDTLSMSMKRDKDQVTGAMAADPGILRLAGKMIADFSKENLEGGGKAEPNKTATKTKKAAEKN